MCEKLLDIEQHIFNNNTYLKCEGKAVLGKKRIAVKNYSKKKVIPMKKIKLNRQKTPVVSVILSLCWEPKQ